MSSAPRPLPCLSFPGLFRGHLGAVLLFPGRPAVPRPPPLLGVVCEASPAVSCRPEGGEGGGAVLMSLGSPTAPPPKSDQSCLKSQAQTDHSLGVHLLWAVGRAGARAGLYYLTCSEN